MSGSLREQILNAPDIKKELLAIDVWGVTVEVRTLTGAQRAACKEASQVTATDEDGEQVRRSDEGKLTAAIVIAATYDPETGKSVFGEADRDALLEKSAAALDKIVGAAGRMSGLTVTEQKAIEKNSDATPSVASTSA